MNFHDFITREELAELPDDPQSAFSEFVRISSGRLKEEVRRLDDNSEEGWHLIVAARHGFVNVVIAVAKQFEIDPFGALSMPKFDERNPYDYNQFKYDLDHYVTQIEIGSAVRARRDTVDLPASSRDRIRSHLHALRGCVEASSMTQARKDTLLRKLEKFEAELERRRVSMLEVSIIAMAFLGFPGAAWSSADIVGKLVSNVLAEVGEVKRTEEEALAVAPPPPIPALSAPRAGAPEPKKIEGLGSRGGYAVRPSDDMDDEIPF